MASERLEQAVADYLRDHPEAKRLDVAQAVGRHPSAVSDTIAWRDRSVNLGPGMRPGEWSSRGRRKQLASLAEADAQEHRATWHRNKPENDEIVLPMSDLSLLGYPCDLHHGSVGCDTKRFDHLVDVTKAEPRLRLFGGGDWLTSVHIRFRSGDAHAEQVQPPQKQLEWLGAGVSELNADEERLVGWHVGNHERRWQKDTGFDLIGWMMDQWGVRVYNGPRFVTFRVGAQSYRVLTTHEIARSSINPFHGHIKLIREHRTPFDAILAGHLHQPVCGRIKGICVATGGTDECMGTAYGEMFGNDATPSYPVLAMHGAPGERHIEIFSSVRGALRYARGCGFSLCLDPEDVHV